MIFAKFFTYYSWTGFGNSLSKYWVFSNFQYVWIVMNYYYILAHFSCDFAERVFTSFAQDKLVNCLVSKKSNDPCLVIHNYLAWVLHNFFKILQCAWHLQIENETNGIVFINIEIVFMNFEIVFKFEPNAMHNIFLV